MQCTKSILFSAAHFFHQVKTKSWYLGRIVQWLEKLAGFLGLLYKHGNSFCMCMSTGRNLMVGKTQVQNSDKHPSICWTYTALRQPSLVGKEHENSLCFYILVHYWWDLGQLENVVRTASAFRQRITSGLILGELVQLFLLRDVEWVSPKEPNWKNLLPLERHGKHLAHWGVFGSMWKSWKRPRAAGVTN